MLFQQCLVDVFGFLKKLFFSNNRWSPPPAVLYIFPIAAKHRFPSNHIGPEWFNTHWRTIHPLDAWTPVSIGSHWARVIQHPPAHHPSTRCLNLLWMNLNLSRAQPARAGPPSLTDWQTKWINIYDVWMMRLVVKWIIQMQYFLLMKIIMWNFYYVNSNSNLIPYPIFYLNPHECLTLNLLGSNEK